MMPLALLAQKRGHEVSGSDRSYDNDMAAAKFAEILKSGISLYPQDGSGIGPHLESLVVSSAIEPSIPDVKAAQDIGLPIITRASLLSQIVNAAAPGICVAGTSGKSTLTGMLGSILVEAGYDPNIINGGVIRNIGSAMRIGHSELVLAETDESDGSIDLYNPDIGVVTNIAQDHKSVGEIVTHFKAFAGRVKQALVLNQDDARTAELASYTKADLKRFSLQEARNIQTSPAGSSFTYVGRTITLNVPGDHNIMNALAAIKAAESLDVSLSDIVAGIETFAGIARRLEKIGTSQKGVTVIDDFAHNPDKIAASLKTLSPMAERLFVLFQPHGFGPMKLMGEDIARAFAEGLREKDRLFVTLPFYAGGTAEKNTATEEMVKTLNHNGVTASLLENREQFVDAVTDEARSGDVVVIMGARDDTLPELARTVLRSV